MAQENCPSLPIIDIDRYIHPTSLDERDAVIAEVREACQKFGFFQVKGHGVSQEAQKGLLQGLSNFFSLPKEDKVKLSFLQNPCRRGYEASGMTLREGDALPDSKEAFYIGREEPVVEPPGFHGPNVWPDLPQDQFKQPISEYYEQTSQLGKIIWEILLQGLGFSTTLMEGFTKRPIIMMKMIRYPSTGATLPGQFGVGAHNDFGGVTVLLQQPEREGLEVWHEESEDWLPVPSIEDVLVINCGDMIQKWSDGVYKSARHRVINKADLERFSCATFWHGDFSATNPLNPNDPNKDTVGQLLLRRFGSQFSLSKETLAAAH
ncbi:2OG-Fe(II) oxygenase [Aspergillus campestris IBT 28561]|uniref:2OG-Fe(II) oxygenase n=1 Tax=Aspergillus campestris (strain IBT 28561) TaxID=1392248 RepID=A0A2I1D2K2_ASPC2|nr:2OG-Fe(II) oxygenase [Aspergillus campestris IBT 28561]PKY04097.1 2OG-Fe(II) oxygenase [Aspergillus campestris IBT 28561]